MAERPKPEDRDEERVDEERGDDRGDTAEDVHHEAHAACDLGALGVLDQEDCAHDPSGTAIAAQIKAISTVPTIAW